MFKVRISFLRIFDFIFNLVNVDWGGVVLF